MIYDFIVFKCYVGMCKINTMVNFIYYCKLLYTMARKERGVWLKLTGAGRGHPDYEFDPIQLAIGIRVEMEHTIDPMFAKAIAKDHLMENPRYYTYLVAMEQELKSGERIKAVYGW
jgi:hypothetical protein